MSNPLTAEEVFDKHVVKRKNESKFKDFLPDTYKQIISAMEEYASQFKRPALPMSNTKNINYERVLYDCVRK